MILITYIVIAILHLPLFGDTVFHLTPRCCRPGAAERCQPLRELPTAAPQWSRCSDPGAPGVDSGTLGADVLAAAFGGETEKGMR